MTSISRRTLLSSAACAALGMFIGVPTVGAHILVRENGTLEDTLRIFRQHVTLRFLALGSYVSAVDSFSAIHNSVGFVVWVNDVPIGKGISETRVKAGDMIEISLVAVEPT